MQNNIDVFEKPTTRIAELVLKSKKKLKDISREADVPYGTLSSYNQGTRIPKKENAVKLADYFGVSVPYLLGFDEDRFAEDTSKRYIIDELTRIRNKRKLLLEQLLALEQEEEELLKTL